MEPAKEVLEALRRASAAVASADHGEVGTVRIAFAGVSTHGLVARLARAVRSQRPGIVLEMSSQNFAQPAMKRLLAGETDIALGRWDVIPADIDATRRHARLAGDGGTGHPRAGRRPPAVDIPAVRRVLRLAASA